MQALIVLTLSFGLLWVLFLLPQKRQVRAHQQLVADLNEGDEVILSAGIYGRITRLSTDDMDVEVAPGVELRVARQAVLRRAGAAGGTVDPLDGPLAAGDTRDAGGTSDISGTSEPDALDRDEMPEPPAGDRV
jgi:preprotein translocase subunit YajC